MAHFEKFQASAIGNMTAHYERRAELERGYERENIDRERTPDNYNLGPSRDGVSQAEFIEARIASLGLKRAPRKDAVRMVDCIVTMPKGYEGDQRQFFEAVCHTLDDEFGRENCVSAWVHLDEATPHVHYAFVPVTDDGRLSAKSILNRGFMQRFHGQLEAGVSQALGIERAGLTLTESERSQRAGKYVGLGEFKAAQEQVTELEDKRKRIQEQCAAETDRLESLQRRVGSVERAVDEARSRVEELESTVRAQRLVSSGVNGRDLRKREQEARGRIQELAGRMPALRDRLSSARTAVEQALARLLSHDQERVLLAGVSLPRATSARLGRTLLDRGYGLLLDSGVMARLTGAQTRLAPKLQRAREAATNPREDYASIGRVTASQAKRREKREHGRGYGR
jgi:hypothetical protein